MVRDACPKPVLLCLISHAVDVGLVDYISAPGTPASERAVQLAEEMAANGMSLLCSRCYALILFV